MASGEAPASALCSGLARRCVRVAGAGGQTAERKGPPKPESRGVAAVGFPCGLHSPSFLSCLDSKHLHLGWPQTSDFTWKKEGRELHCLNCLLTHLSPKFSLRISEAPEMEHTGHSTNICWISELIDLVVLGKFILK